MRRRFLVWAVFSRRFLVIIVGATNSIYKTRVHQQGPTDDVSYRRCICCRRFDATPQAATAYSVSDVRTHPGNEPPTLNNAWMKIAARRLPVFSR